jgi:hypothetical protein
MRRAAHTGEVDSVSASASASASVSASESASVSASADADSDADSDADADSDPDTGRFDRLGYLFCNWDVSIGPIRYTVRAWTRVIDSR